MSFAIGHFALGAAVTALIVTYLLPNAPYPRTLVLTGGLWALIPDAAKLVTSPKLTAFHESVFADLFWFHRTLDRIDAPDSAGVSALFVALFFLVTVLVERRERQQFSRTSDGYDDRDVPSQ